MKAIVTLLILGGLALGGVYLFGGYQNFDPNKQGKEAEAKITPGMSLQQVIDAAGPNGKYRSISIMKGRKEDDEYEQMGPPRDLDINKLKGQISRNEVPNGFAIEYIYSNQTAFGVRFDSTGTVTEKYEVATMGDLLQSR